MTSDINGFSRGYCYDLMAQGMCVGDAIRQYGDMFMGHILFGDPLLSFDDNKNSVPVTSHELPTPGTNPIHLSPNPFRNTIAITFDAPIYATVSVYNPRGTLVRRLSTTNNTQDLYIWDGHDSTGKKVSPGMYLLVIQNGSIQRTKKIQHL